MPPSSDSHWEEGGGPVARDEAKQSHPPVREIAWALTGYYRPGHLFALKQALALSDAYGEQLREWDAEIERQFANLKRMVPPNDQAPLDATDKRESKRKLSANSSILPLDKILRP